MPDTEKPDPNVKHAYEKPSIGDVFYAKTGATMPQIDWAICIGVKEYGDPARREWRAVLVTGFANEIRSVYAGNHYRHVDGDWVPAKDDSPITLGQAVTLFHKLLDARFPATPRQEEDAVPTEPPKRTSRVAAAQAG